VARSVGLAVPDFNPADVDLEIPKQILGTLRVDNLADALKISGRSFCSAREAAQVTSQWSLTAVVSQSP
jgi:hypothetical protein